MQKYFTEARSLLALGIPIVLAQFSQTAMGFVDTVMAGSVSEIEMSAVAVVFHLAASYSFWPRNFDGINPNRCTNEWVRPSQPNRHDQIQQGLWLALLLALGIICLLYNSQLIISNMPHIDKRIGR